MSLILKKLSGNRLAFFSFISFILFAQTVDAQVRCRGRDRAESVSRNEIAAGGGGGSESEFAIVGTKSATVMLNGSTDLNVSPDVSSFAHGIVTESTRWLWRVNANNNDNITGYITAEYQFNGLVSGDNKICSSPTSCIQVTNISPSGTQTRRFGNNNNPNNNIRRVREGISFTMDLNGVQDGGTYVGELEITLNNGPNADGSGNTSLTCNIIL